MKLQICYTSARVTSAAQLQAPPFPAATKVPPGHVPVHVGEAMEPPERFMIRVEMLNRPVFLSLLDRTAQELGYQRTAGALRILCAVQIFRRILASLSSGEDDEVAAAAEVLSFSGDGRGN